MNRRTFLLVLAVVLLLAGVGLSIRDILFAEPQAPTLQTVLVATQDVETYTVLTADMVEERQEPAEVAANALGPPLDGRRTLITRQAIAAGETISRDAVAVVGGDWRPGNLDLEVISFPATFDKVVGGQIKPGHRVNVYGFLDEEETNLPPVTLVARNIWVVDARTRTGEAAEAPTPESGQEEEGRFGFRALDTGGGDPASVVTVAVNPEVAVDIIEALGAQRYQAWVTLAGSGAAPVPEVSPRPALGLDKHHIRLEADEGGEAVTDVFSVRNEGGGTLRWTASAEDVDWLTNTPRSGSGSTTVVVTGDPQSVDSGVYVAVITVEGESGTVNSPQTVVVEFHVRGAEPTEPEAKAPTRTATPATVAQASPTATPSTPQAAATPTPPPPEILPTDGGQKIGAATFAVVGFGMLLLGVAGLWVSG